MEVSHLHALWTKIVGSKICLAHTFSLAFHNQSGGRSTQSSVRVTSLFDGTPLLTSSSSHSMTTNPWGTVLPKITWHECKRPCELSKTPPLLDSHTLFLCIIFVEHAREQITSTTTLAQHTIFQLCSAKQI